MKPKTFSMLFCFLTLNASANAACDFRSLLSSMTTTRESYTQAFSKYKNELQNQILKSKPKDFNFEKYQNLKLEFISNPKKIPELENLEEQVAWMNANLTKLGGSSPVEFVLKSINLQNQNLIFKTASQLAPGSVARSKAFVESAVTKLYLTLDSPLGSELSKYPLIEREVRKYL